jgi:hypothetical protein
VKISFCMAEWSLRNSCCRVIGATIRRKLNHGQFNSVYVHRHMCEGNGITPGICV